MKTADKKMIAMFHSKGNKVKFVEFKPIHEAGVWDELFIRDYDEDGNELPEDERGLYDGGGEQLMDGEELDKALSTGIGRIELDSYNNVIYTTYAEDLDEKELRCMVNTGRGFYYLECELDEALRQAGFDDEEIAVARHFDEFDEMIESLDNYHNYVDANYYIIDNESNVDDEADYLHYNDKYYVKR